MKVRLYRGPLNGKVVEVRDGERELMVAHQARPKRGSKSHWNEVFPPDGTMAQFQMPRIEHHLYRMAYMRGPMIPGSLPAMHPDGSYFFEWTKPRGSRTR